MMTKILLRRAVPKEASYLSALALRSKAHWGYSSDFIKSCENELTFTQSQVDGDEFDFIVAEIDYTILGFYATKRLTATEFELEALFVEPNHIGIGVGRQLIEHALQSIRTSAGTILRIQGDPNAEDFYVAAGGKKVGSKESGSVPGRYLPLFEIAVPGQGEGVDTGSRSSTH